MVLEIRTYKLVAGSRAEFDRLFREEAVPLLATFSIDVVRHGPSLLDDDHYLLLRAFGDLAGRDRAEDEFYGSSEWHQGPRAAVLSHIESYHEVVLEVTPDEIEALRG